MFLQFFPPTHHLCDLWRVQTRRMVIFICRVHKTNRSYKTAGNCFEKVTFLETAHTQKCIKKYYFNAFQISLVDSVGLPSTVVLLQQQRHLLPHFLLYRFTPSKAVLSSNCQDSQFCYFELVNTYSDYLVRVFARSTHFDKSFISHSRVRRCFLLNTSNRSV